MKMVFFKQKAKQLIVCSTLFYVSIACASTGITHDFERGNSHGWYNNFPKTITDRLTFIVSNDRLPREDGQDRIGANDKLKKDRINNFWLLQKDQGDTKEYRDEVTKVAIFSSPSFTKKKGVSIKAWALGGAGAGIPKWSNSLNIPKKATASGFLGIALRRVSDGEYLLFSSRTKGGQFSSWEAIGWKSDVINSVTRRDHANETYAVDLIDTYAGGWGWIVIDDVTFKGVKFVDKKSHAKHSVKLTRNGKIVSWIVSNESARDQYEIIDLRTGEVLELMLADGRGKYKTTVGVGAKVKLVVKSKSGAVKGVY